MHERKMPPRATTTTEEEAEGEEEECPLPVVPTEQEETAATAIDTTSTTNNNHTNISSHEHDQNANPWKNRNVILALLWGVTAGVADSIWANTILSGFLLALAQAMHHHHHNSDDNSEQQHDDNDDNDNNTLVGTAEAIQGIAMLLSALPVGLIADWFGKARVVAYGGVLFAITIGIHLIALVKAKRAVDCYDDDDDDSTTTTDQAKHAYQWMLVALALWGIGQGIVEGPAQALFADSIPQGQRSALMTWQYTSYLLSSMVGPIVGVVMLARRGTEESWSLAEIYPVFCVGVLLEIPGVVIMFFFSDEHTIVEQEEQERENANRARTPQIAAIESADNNDLETPLLQDQGEEHVVLAESTTTTTTTTTRRNWHEVGKASIPYVLFLASLVTSLGSGASVKYFPLFFGELGFSSAFVQGIYILVPLSIALCSVAAQRTSRKFGRIETTVLFALFGVGLLFYMTRLSRNEMELSDFKKYEIIAVYLVRTGVMNAGYPLLESVLMDVLPSNQRARWKSLEAVAAFGWTGSALIGGILADERSYRFTFAITASLQLVGTLMLLPLQPFVEPEIDSEQEQESEGPIVSAEQADGEANTTTSQESEGQN